MITFASNLAYVPTVGGMLPGAIVFPVNPVGVWLLLLLAIVIACAGLSLLSGLSLPQRKKPTLRVLRPSVGPRVLAEQA